MSNPVRQRRITLADRLRTRWYATSPIRIFAWVIAIGLAIITAQKFADWMHNAMAVAQAVQP